MIKITIDDEFCAYEFELSEEADRYCINDILNNAIRKIPGKPKIKVVNEKLLK